MKSLSFVSTLRLRRKIVSVCLNIEIKKIVSVSSWYWESVSVSNPKFWSLYSLLEILIIFLVVGGGLEERFSFARCCEMRENILLWMIKITSNNIYKQFCSLSLPHLLWILFIFRSTSKEYKIFQEKSHFPLMGAKLEKWYR